MKMGKSTKDQAVGMTLVEILLALALISMIVVAALQATNLLKYKRQVAQLAQAVDYTLILMNEFYYSDTFNPNQTPPQYNCRDAVLADETKTTLATVLAANAKYHFSSLNANQLALIGSLGLAIKYQALKSANAVAPTPYSFQVSVSLPQYSLTQVQNIQAQLNADPTSVNPATITWTRLPNNGISNTVDNSLWVAFIAHQLEMDWRADPTGTNTPTYCPI